MTGPWGQLELTRIALEPPREVVSRLPPNEPPRWLFSTTDRQAVLATLRDSGLTRDQLEQCDQRGRWVTGPKALSLDPPMEVVFGLQRSVREKLYRMLATSAENVYQRNPILVSPDVVAAVEDAHLTTTTVEHFHQLLYGPGPWRLLSDLPALLTVCASAGERVRLLGALLRSESYLARLVIDDKTNVEALVEYWSAHGRAETVRPLIESLARLPGEAAVDVRGLMPSWQSGRVNRYPRRADPVEPRADCFWTALNFFADQPGPPLDKPAAVMSDLKTHYRAVTAPSFGDVIILVNEAGTPVHAAVHIADGLVLTKNGVGVLRPWTYMKLSDVQALYTSVNGKLQTIYLTELGPAERPPAAAP